MPVEWALIFKGNRSTRNCSCHKAVKFLEYGMVLERVLDKRFCRVVTVDEMQFGSMHEKNN